MKNWRKKNSRKKCFHSYYTVSEVVNFFLIHTFPKTENRSTRNLSTTPSRTPEKKGAHLRRECRNVYILIPTCFTIAAARRHLRIEKVSRKSARAPAAATRTHVYASRRFGLVIQHEEAILLYGLSLSLSLSLSLALSLSRTCIYICTCTLVARVLYQEPRARMR